MTDRHHLLEIILWPESDGTYKTILNTKARLKELNIYDDFKLTIKLDRAVHTALHRRYTTDETKMKMGRLGRTYTMTDEWKAKISASKLGKHRSEETKAKIREKMRGRKRPPMSDEWKAKISESHRKRKITLP